ncbi:MAG: ABC transporter permease [Lachnospiraceae bacterium]|nr:ABC transporter permease [Lachnospiraceae bacterium]
MKILRLSLFNLKKNKREAIGIAILTFFTTLMLAIAAANHAKVDKVFDECFAESGSKDYAILFRGDKYRNAFKDVLHDDYGVGTVAEGRMLSAPMIDTYSPDGDTVSYNYTFVTEKTERKLEDFLKRDELPDEEIAELEHPIWLPVNFQIVKDYHLGDDFTIFAGGKEFEFVIAGFYETGLMCSDGWGFKTVISDEDYDTLTGLFTSSTDCEGVLLMFDSTESFDYDEYLEKCSEVAAEDISLNTRKNYVEEEKTNESSFLSIYMLMIVALSMVTFVASLFMIRHKISNDIEDQMQQIGVLEALGYRSREISLAYLYEYVIAGSAGAILGAIVEIITTPALNKGISMMLGRSVQGSSDILSVVLVTVLIIVAVVVFALLKARTVKNYPPVIALRKGIKTHNFSKNFLPLEKSKINVNLALSLKGLFGNLKSCIGIVICIVTAGTALLFSALTFDCFKDGAGGLISMMGIDTDMIFVDVMDNVDTEWAREEILKLPGVRKVLIRHDGDYLSVKGSSEAAVATVFDDFSEAENINPFLGRCPERDNEVMIGRRRSESECIEIGDSILLEHNGIEKKYLVTGIIGSLHNGGSTVYLTSEGYERIVIDAKPRLISVYPEPGVSLTELEETVAAHFGGTAKDAELDLASIEDPDERIKAAAEAKIAILLSQYGVTDVDYAVRIGDRLITGNSRNFVIKEIRSYEGITKTQLVPIGETTRTFTFLALFLIAGIVGVILSIISSSEVRRQRLSLGIMKGLGYSSKDLMTQIAMKFMPVIVLSVIIASVCVVFVNEFFWGALFATVADTSIPVIILVDILLILFCYGVTYLSAGRIKKISVNELMTE